MSEPVIDRGELPNRVDPLPCPFCGAVARRLVYHDLYRFSHANTCWLGTRTGADWLSFVEPEDVELWNSRFTTSGIQRDTDHA